VTDLQARCFIRRDKTLVSSDFAAEEFLAGIKNGREVVVSVRLARSPQHHRWFFSLLRKVVDNTDNLWGDEDDLLDDLKFAVGHVRRRVNLLTGEVYMVAKSINFSSMGEDKFRRFRDRCLFVIQRSTGIDPVELMQEVDAEQGMKSAPPDRPRRLHAFWKRKGKSVSESVQPQPKEKANGEGQATVDSN
jgi:hypothetical protein